MDLALLGDSIIKFIYSDFLLDKVELLTEVKKNYESDKIFVDKIASYYNLIPYIDYDRGDSEMPDDYNYDSKAGTNKNSHKYIATAVEWLIHL